MSTQTTQEELISALKSRNLLSLTVSKAMQQAVKSHSDQKRDNGGSYLEQHVFAITMSIVHKYKQFPQLEKLVVLALLHDCLEDDSSFSVDECRQSFGSETTDDLLLLTKRKPKDRRLSQKEKMELNRSHVAKISKSSLLVQIIKLEDRLNNLSSTLPTNLVDKYVRYAHETKQIFLPLAEQVSPQYVDLLRAEVERLQASLGTWDEN